LISRCWTRIATLIGKSSVANNDSFIVNENRTMQVTYDWCDNDLYTWDPSRTGRALKSRWSFFFPERELKIHGPRVELYK